MLGHVFRFLPLLGVLLLASPSRAHAACDELPLSTLEPAEGAERQPQKPAAPAAPEPLAWCERADDPRCTPGSPTTPVPEVGPTPLVVRSGVPGIPGAHARDARFGPTALIGPRSGIRYRVERPPRR